MGGERAVMAGSGLSEAEWEALVREAEQSGLKRKGFCEARGVAVSWFDSCRYRYRRLKHRSDCSGERRQALPNRSSKYLAQNSQKEAYQGVLSPERAFGLEDISQPLTTSRRSPFRRSLSRWVRVSSFGGNTRRPFICTARSAVRD